MSNVKPTSSGSGIWAKQHADSPHLLTGHGLGKEIVDVRDDLNNVLAPLAAMVIDEWTNPPTGATLTLSRTPKMRAGLRCVIKEIVDGVVVTTGTISATVYTPATALTQAAQDGNLPA